MARNRKYQDRRSVPKSKRLKNNPYATRGVKLHRLTGGLITKKRLPDGRLLVTVTSEAGEQQTYIEQGPGDQRPEDPRARSRTAGYGSRDRDIFDSLGDTF